MKNKVAVLGGGSFGTVLANIAASNGNEVTLWVRDVEQALRINSEGANATYHPELKLSSNITASEDLNEVVSNAQTIFIATPSIIFETIVKRIAPLIDNGINVISCTKGIRHNPFKTMTDIISDNLSIKKIKIGVLSGPNLAREIADNKIAGTVVASSDKPLIDSTKQILSSNTFKIYSSSDVNGIELAGALKNIYAIICGLASSLEVGENANGLILTRSMAEMSRFAVAKGANPITFLGLAGMGDLLATCTSTLSRNFQLGAFLGKGLNLNDSKNEVGQVAEGIRTLEVAHEEATKYGINMPLMESLYNIIYKNSKPETLLDDLINHPHEIDVEFTHRGN